MKKTLFLALTLALVLGAMPVLASGSAKVYGSVTLYNWGHGNFSDIWDLTQCDLTLSYTINMSAIANAGWAVTEVGLREVGAPNIDPNLKGGWMQSNYISATSNPNSQNNNDMHLLSKHGWLYQQYDASDANTLITPYWSGANYGFWFDRDGVDQWQANLWGAVDGGTYNTEGIYNIVVTYHALDANQGTMFATIKGIQQGLYVGGWKNAQPEFYPAGRSFTGDMTQMQVFYGRGGGGGTVTVSDITVTGCPYWLDVAIDIKPGSDPNCFNSDSHGVIPVAILGSADFDASTVDPFTVSLDSAQVRVKGKSGNAGSLEDVNGDGFQDLVVQILDDGSYSFGDTTATLKGLTSDGVPIMGTDTICIRPPE